MRLPGWQVVLEKLQKDGAKKAKAAESAQSGWYCGKLFAMCTGKHEANVEERTQALEAVKAKESEKIEQLDQARRDLASTEGELRAMQAQVGELQGCRQSEMALVEGLFTAGTIKDETEQQLQRAYLELGPQLHQARAARQPLHMLPLPSTINQHAPHACAGTYVFDSHCGVVC